jgi:hypothetical protein
MRDSIEASIGHNIALLKEMRRKGNYACLVVRAYGSGFLPEEPFK